MGQIDSTIAQYNSVRKDCLLKLFPLYCTVLDYTVLYCTSICMYSMNVETAEPTGPKFSVGPYMAPKKVCRWSIFQKFASQQNLIFIKSKKKNFIKSANFFLFLFYNVYKEKMITVEIQRNKYVLGVPENIKNSIFLFCRNIASISTFCPAQFKISEYEK